MGDELDRTDAALMLQVMHSYMTEPMASARRFWSTLPDGISLSDVDAAHPRGSEGWSHLTTVLIFWETVGGLIKRGLLREELAFDTILDVPPWPKIEQFFLDLRAERSDPREGENLEYTYRRAMAYAEADRASRTSSE